MTTKHTPTLSLTPRRKGKGYKLGPHDPKPLPEGALWMTSGQMCDRFGGKSKMWLWTKVKNDPDFPKPRYDGRMQIYSVAEADEYDRKLLMSKTREVA